MHHRGAPILTGVEDRMVQLRQLEQQHKGDSPYEKARYFETPEETSQKPIFDIIGRTEIWWIPIIPLVCPPIILLAFSHILEAESTTGPSTHFLYELLYLFLTPIIILVFLSPIILPFYAVYLVRINRRRKENGTSNLFLTMFHILSFVPPLFVFLLFWVWASAQGA